MLGACAGGGGGAGLASGALGQPTFVATIEPSTISIPQGETGAALVNILPQNGFTGTVSLTLDASPAGVTLFGISIWVPPGALAVSQPVAIEAGESAPLGTTELLLLARSGTKISMASFNLEILPPLPPPAPEFSLFLQPAAATIPQGNETTTQLSIAPLHGFQGLVDVTLDSAPPGVSIDDLPAQVFVDQTANLLLHVRADASTIPGNYSLKIGANSGVVAKTAIFPLTVLDAHPGTAMLGVSFDIKLLRFFWSPVENAQNYRLLEELAPGSGFTQISPDLPESATSLDFPIALYEHAGSNFLLQACNGFGCTDSNEISVASALQAAIGYFKASNTASADHFGQAMALSADGGTLAIAAPDENGIAANSGAVYVFARTGASWTQQAYLKASNAEKDDRFGAALSLSADGNLLVIGAPAEDSAATGVDGDASDNSASNAGAAYVFLRNGTNWSQQSYLKASNAAAGDAFGSAASLSADGTTLALGAPSEDGGSAGIGGDETSDAASNAGAAYVFSRTGVSWIQQAYVKASNPDSGDHFGTSLALSSDGNTLAAGADAENGGAGGIGGDESDNSAANAGAVYVFARAGTNWSQQAYVKASTPSANDTFGVGLSISHDGNRLGVGAPGQDATALDSGAAYLFARNGSSWSEIAMLKAPIPGSDDDFGRSIAISGDGETLAVGAPNEDSAAIALDGSQNDNTAPDAGAVFLFRQNGGIWNLLSYLKASNTEAGDHFGIAVALSDDGDTLTIGADDEDSNATGVNGDATNNAASNAGAAYLY